MKKIRIVLAAISFLVFSLSFDTLQDWFLLQSKEFSIEFPAKPTNTTQNVNSSVGELKMDIHMFDASSDGGDNLVYGLITSEYPDSLINSNKTEFVPTFFRNSIDGAVKNVEGKLLSEKTIAIDKFPGREIKVDFRDGLATITMRMYLVKNKMIITQTIAEPTKDGNATALKFHNSLKLKN